MVLATPVSIAARLGKFAQTVTIFLYLPCLNILPNMNHTKSSPLSPNEC
jgi:hypothetical protein